MVFLMIFMYNIKVARSVVKMNDKIFIFGHKNPDTDTVTSAIALSYLKNKLGFNSEPYVLGEVNL